MCSFWGWGRKHSSSLLNIHIEGEVDKYYPFQHPPTHKPTQPFTTAPGPKGVMAVISYVLRRLRTLYLKIPTLELKSTPRSVDNSNSYLDTSLWVFPSQRSASLDYFPASALLALRLGICPKLGLYQFETSAFFWQRHSPVQRTIEEHNKCICKLFVVFTLPWSQAQNGKFGVFILRSYFLR